MPIFDQIEFAIQEAQWCADHYDEKQVIIKVRYELDKIKNTKFCRKSKTNF